MGEFVPLNKVVGTGLPAWCKDLKDLRVSHVDTQGKNITEHGQQVQRPQGRSTPSRFGAQQGGSVGWGWGVRG